MSAHITRFKPRPCPEPGDGVHRWVFHAACCAIEAGLPDDEAIMEIESMMTREPNDDEIEDALAAARGERRRSSPVWPKVNAEQIEAIAQHGPRLIDLWKSSPESTAITRFNRAEQIVDCLFPGNPLLCVGYSQKTFFTMRREKLTGALRLRDFALIVPSPMTAEKGRTKTGKISEHSLANTGQRRFLVTEFDKGTLDHQAALLHHLSRIAPSLALVVFSGSKSLHGWFYCENQAEDIQLRLMRYAVSLGADCATWIRSQFVRMPDGKRQGLNHTTGALESCGIPGVPPSKQVALYFNPRVTNQ